MKIYFLTCISFALLLSITPARAEDSDSLLCALGHVTDCDSAGNCERLAPTMVGLPRFIDIDLKARVISEVDATTSARSTKIVQVTRTDAGIVLQGVQLGKGWSVVINESGELHFGIVDVDGIVSGSGGCRPTASS